MGVAENLRNTLNGLPASGCTLIAVSKTKPEKLIIEAYETGHRDFGENKVQDLAHKYESLPKDIRWHMIGHLQRNKVKYIAPFVHLIHGVDSIKLLSEIEKQAAKSDRIIQCLLQIHIAEESSKFGFDQSEVMALIASKELTDMSHIKIAGLMGMATFTPDQEQVRKEFRGLKFMFESLRQSDLPKNVEMKTLSMGMSGDYQIAIEEGSNMVRIGTAIFGERNY